jgi:hypothetical protein
MRQYIPARGAGYHHFALVDTVGPAQLSILFKTGKPALAVAGFAANIPSGFQRHQQT